MAGHNQGGGKPAQNGRRYRIAATSRPARHLTLASLTPADGAALSFRAGQYARVGFDGLPPRNLSIASAPGSPALEFHIRDRAGHGGDLFQRLKPGEEVVVEGPFGAGFWREDHAGPILAAAGGAGLAPVKSIIETALGRGMTQPIHLYFGVRDEPDLYLESHFDALARAHRNLRFVPVLSKVSKAQSRRTGLLAEALAADFPALAGFKAYVFGPGAMVHATIRALRALGIEPGDIHTDEPP
jgi:ferredoxin-NAD(P)+ reductase (naphthalene dioxygenase ferredoxin-specific)